jgi:hypothetical protein
VSGELHKQLVTLAAAWLRKSHSVVVTEIASGSESPDAIGFTSGHSTMIECKASRSDFKADAKKPFRLHPPGGLGMFRYYMAPAGMLEVWELPDAWGLLEVNGNRVRCRLKANPQKSDRGRECAILVSLIRRVAKVQPEGSRIRYYPILTSENITIGIEEEELFPIPSRPDPDTKHCTCERGEGEDEGGPFDNGHWGGCEWQEALKAAEEWDLKYRKGGNCVLPE